MPLPKTQGLSPCGPVLRGCREGFLGAAAFEEGEGAGVKQAEHSRKKAVWTKILRLERR